jgi:hypothetical protein
MDNADIALLHLMAAAALGWVIQWALFAPKNVPAWVAWAALAISTVVLYWWCTPTVLADFQTHWRLAIIGLVQFFLTAKGAGRSAAALKAAPKSNSL